MSSIEVREKRDVRVLKRKEVVIDVEFSGKATPSEAEVKKMVAAQLKADEALVVVKKVGQHFGMTKATITARIYDDEKALKDVEEIKKRKKEEAKSGKEGEAKK